MVIKPKKENYPDLVSFAHAMALYFEEIRYQALLDIRQIDSASNRGLRGARIIPKPLPTRETERERISIHEKAQNNPLLREILRKMTIKY
jgi:hypothetical protein